MTSTNVTYTKPVAIFSIDNEDDFTTLKKFMMYLDNLWVLGHLNYKPRKCVGGWEGSMEESFVMDLADFNEYAKSWCVNQDAILEVHPKSYRQPHIKMAFCNYLKLERVITLGEFVPTNPSEMYLGEAFTYFMDTKEYFVCRN